MAITALSQTIIHLTKAGRFRQAADREKEIGQIYLQESNDIKKACESFERAGEWYAQEDATAYNDLCVFLRDLTDIGITELPMHASKMRLTFMQTSSSTHKRSLAMSKWQTIHWVQPLQSTVSRITG